MSKQTFLQGTLILIAAGMITRVLGFVNRIVVARIMGEEGVGLYMMAIPTLVLVITLTQFGLPVAISKRVAEAEATGDLQKIKKILVTSLLVTGVLSILFTTGMIMLAPLLSHTLLTDSRTMYPLLAISPIVPIVAISSVLRGYFQGRQNMRPQAYSQVIEQIVRISCVALFTNMLLPYGVEFAAAGAMISVVLGEFVSLLYMIYMFKTKKRIRLRMGFMNYVKEGKETLQGLMSIALPTTGSRMVGSLSFFFEPIVVAQSLAIAGVQTVVATKQYGELTGYALPLLLLPTFITQSLSVALVPNISEAEAKGNQQLTHYRIRQAIRLSFASGALATVILTIFAHPILTFMYGSGNAAPFLYVMGPLFLLLYFQAPLQAALQSLDLAKAAMWNSLIGALVKFAVMFTLATREDFGIMGVAIAIVVGVVLVTLLHLFTLMNAIQFKIPVADLIKMVTLFATTWLVGTFLNNLFPGAANSVQSFLLLLCLYTAVYIVLLFALRFITKDELQQLPLFKKK
ncbi:stage V sporulation protein B [Pontibacillus halophilus JSM 076056 = DSM 19796]|uniref:Stage V sporulation protein B n=1 Tax=Pontibacillus halophilus JSM 076056 = DSM 19796 TaxID=1385510 RepID=A0A0A5GNJ6_9BACI|nr:stage V sporulation protein B [Pontibacillus halophilus]KGX93509.1 stage V sporulation protein B [Pontibacillus halophilus JSM 076056 = DSM 19796]